MWTPSARTPSRSASGRRTGKTYLAMAMATSALLAGQVARIILTRPVVEAGEKLGFLPGGLMEKVDPYLRPLFDALYDMMDTERLTKHLENGSMRWRPLPTCGDAP